MIDLAHDLRFGVRMLLRHPTVTLISLLTLGLGIGATTAVFSVVDATVLTPPPFDEPDSLVRLFTAKPAVGWRTMTVSAPDFRDWSEQSPSIEAAGIFDYRAVNVMGDEHADRLLQIRASAEVLQVLRMSPVLGRAYDAAADRTDAEPVVLLSDATWRQRFGGDPDVVGTVLRIDDVAHEVIGVLPPEANVAMRRFDLWTPFPSDSAAESRSRRLYNSIARLTRGVTVAEADRELKVVGDRLAQAYPDSNRGHTVNVMSLTEVLLGRNTRSVLIALGAAVGFVLLIACVNIANLLLATATSREREFAVRAAFGAGPRQLARQLITESALLAAAGGALGIAIAYWSVDLFTAGLQATVGFMGHATVDVRALGFSLIVLAATSLGIGVPVAIRASRSRLPDAIQGSSRGVYGNRPDRIQRDLMVVAQVSLALALMICAGLMIRSLVALKAVDPGFETDHLLTMRVSLPDGLYPSDAERSAFFEIAVGEIETLPGVRSVAATSTIPLVGSNSNSSMSIEEHPISDPADAIFVGNETVTPGYLETMGIPLVEGREFNTLDRGETPRVIIINRLMARHFWPDESAIGKRVKFGLLNSDFPWLEVVGVMGDHRQTSLDVDPRFETLHPQLEIPSSAMTFVVRTEPEPASLASAVREAIQRVGPELAVYDVATMDEILARNTRSLDDLTNLLAGFGVVALVLALSGVYGLLAFTVGLRTREIGLRMALGAEARSILVSVLSRSTWLLLCGVLAGGLIAWLLSRWLRGMLFEVSTLDPAVYAVAAVGMLAVGLLAGLIPALRAATIDPVIALRNE
jgi:putative ABC transport system permease protein